MNMVKNFKEIMNKYAKMDFDNVKYMLDDIL